MRAWTKALFTAAAVAVFVSVPVVSAPVFAASDDVISTGQAADAPTTVPTADGFLFPIDGTLRPDQPVRGSVGAPGDYRTYTLDVPRGSHVVTLVLDADRDLDLFVRHGQQMQNWEADPDFASFGLTGREYVTITSGTSPALKPGTYYVDVANLGEEPFGGHFSLTAYFRDAVKDNTVKISPLNRISEQLSGQYEFVVADDLSVALEGYYQTVDFGDRFDSTAFGIASGERWYGLGAAPYGFYLGSGSYLERVNFKRHNADGSEDPGKATIAGMTGEVGYQWVMANGLVLDVGGSLKWPWLVDTFYSVAEPPRNMKRIATSLFLSTGYAW